MVIQYTRGPCGSADVRIHQAHQLIVHRFGFLLTPANSAGGTMFEMVAHELASHRPKCLLHRGNLRQHVGTVSLFLHHPLQPAYLPLYAPKAPEAAVLDRRVHRGSFPASCLAAAPAGLSPDRLMS